MKQIWLEEGRCGGLETRITAALQVETVSKATELHRVAKFLLRYALTLPCAGAMPLPIKWSVVFSISVLVLCIYNIRK
ncbi:hypothetical protein J6590_068651 [Homalodisca vitripennis]|nr:hypothetical protein J6590_068651 [Homalodisca vitripennis]